MISAMLNKDDTNIHVIMNSMRIWKINAEVKIILLGVGVWHGLLTLQWVTMQMLIMATIMARHTPVKAPDFCSKGSSILFDHFIDMRTTVNLSISCRKNVFLLKFSNKNTFFLHEMDKLTVVLMSMKWLNKIERTLVDCFIFVLKVVQSYLIIL